MIGLALAYLRDRPLTTALNVLLLAISVAMLVLLVQFGSQASERFERDARGIDLVIGAKGSPLQLILSSVFHVDQPTGNIPLSSLDLLRRDPAVARAVPMALGDSFRGYRIVGSDASFAELYRAEIAQGTTFRAPMQAVLGAQVAADTGAQLGQKFLGSHGFADDSEGDHVHEASPFETVGILKPTGSVIDRLILTSYESVWDVHGIAQGHEHEEDASAAMADPPVLQAASRELEPELTALLVTYRNASGAIRIPAMIDRQTGMQAAVPANETARLLELLGASLDGVRLFAWLLALTGGLAIFVALLNMARSRESDLALLRVMGASRVQVLATLIMEGVITAALGAMLGWLGAHALIAAARAGFPTLADLGFAPWQPLAAEVGLVLAVLGIGVLAALVPAIKVYRIDPARILARG
jgi:putative ABC transport system permease protein